jgi:hypothetical protein
MQRLFKTAQSLRNQKLKLKMRKRKRKKSLIIM